MSTTVRPRRERPEADWDLVFKRNPVERIKRDKAPLGIRDELPALIAAGYEAVAEEDIVRLQWWGLYHDKPKIGTFMLRVKLPAGFVEPVQAARDRRGLEPLRQGRRRARDTSERAAAPPGLGEPARRLRPARRCGHHDCRRLRRHGAQHHRLARPGHRPARAVRLHGRHPAGGRFLLRQPRLLEPPAQAQVLDRGLARSRQRARDQLHRARGRGPRGTGGLRRARRRRALVGAAHRTGAGRVRAQGRGRRGAGGDHGGLGGRPQLPRQPRQGAAQVHDRRHRARGHARARRGAARSQAGRLRPAGARARLARPPRASTRRSSPASATSACRCTSASSRAIR